MNNLTFFDWRKSTGSRLPCMKIPEERGREGKGGKGRTTMHIGTGYFIFEVLFQAQNEFCGVTFGKITHRYRGVIIAA